MFREGGHAAEADVFWSLTTCCRTLVDTIYTMKDDVKELREVGSFTCGSIRNAGRSF